MPAYAVFEPPLRGRSISAHADRFIFLRERFSLAAFVFGPLWMIWRRLWLALIIYLVATSLIEWGLQSLGTPIGARTTVYVLLQLLIAFEAANLWRWTLLRRGWSDRGIVFGDDLELAERRFFAANPPRHAADPTSPPSEPEPLHPHPPPPAGEGRAGTGQGTGGLEQQEGGLRGGA
jgi:hypothetical protein